jgi:hypothetical protein
MPVVSEVASLSFDYPPGSRVGKLAEKFGSRTTVSRTWICAVSRPPAAVPRYRPRTCRRAGRARSGSQRSALDRRCWRNCQRRGRASSVPYSVAGRKSTRLKRHEESLGLEINNCMSRRQEAPRCEADMASKQAAKASPTAAYSVPTVGRARDWGVVIERLVREDEARPVERELSPKTLVRVSGQTRTSDNFQASISGCQAKAEREKGWPKHGRTGWRRMRRRMPTSWSRPTRKIPRWNQSKVRSCAPYIDKLMRHAQSTVSHWINDADIRLSNATESETSQSNASDSLTWISWYCSLYAG